MGSKRWPGRCIRKHSSNDDDAYHPSAHLDRLRHAGVNTRRGDCVDVVAGQRTVAGARFAVCDLFRRYIAVWFVYGPVRDPFSASITANFVGRGGWWFAWFGRCELPGTAAQSARRTLSAGRFKRCGSRHDDRARVLRCVRMEPAGVCVRGCFDCDARGLSTRAWTDGCDARTLDPRRCDRDDVSVVSNSFCHDVNGCHSHQVVHVLAARGLIWIDTFVAAARDRHHDSRHAGTDAECTFVESVDAWRTRCI